MKTSILFALSAGHHSDFVLVAAFGVSIDELEADVDAWLEQHNEQKPNSGKYSLGKTPMQTVLDTLHIAKEKMIGDHPTDSVA